MIPFTLKSKSAEPDCGALLSTLRRTGTRDLQSIFALGGHSPGALLAHLERPPGRLRDPIRTWDDIAGALPGPLSGTERGVMGRVPLPAQRDWVRQLAEGLGAAPEVEAAIGVAGRFFADLIERDVQARALERHAELAKDGAMDLRALTGAYGFFLLATVLDWLRARVAGASEEEANALLRDFAPVLVLIGQVLDDEEKARAA